ncbi:MAG: Asp-tRNA(Asn)/Glu-tRNA(Gln) amidotransferase subunit GatB [Lentisphaeraceae bacterium]|nr:Asp-tRNA(Asn)/Glu-tRNA(Gln) amidotransferase subunit GatB [Lentisphaeraceae bacterium]
MSKYEVIIGLEIHVQAKTESKVFCSCKNSFGAPSNSSVCPICLGHPGVLPVVNREAIHQIVKAGLMTDSDIARYSKFDRKSYFYPDQPKNYQITQFDLPFCANGKIPIGGKGLSGEMIEPRDIGMERIHLEEDVGKSVHYSGSHSTVDYNRAGVPLLETVSMPQMHSADEAYAYVQSLQQIMRFGGISDCDQEKGQFRCDVNISLHKPGTPFGTKIEIKNLNSTRHIWLSINHEIERQTEILDDLEGTGPNGEDGKLPDQETRRWNDARGETVVMRIKETADDYRYFPEPDLPPVVLTDAQIDAFKAEMPMPPKAYREKFVNEFKITEYDAHVLTLDKSTADFFLAAGSKVKKPKAVANIMMNQLNALLSDGEKSLDETKLEPDHLVQMVKLVEANKIQKNAYAKLLPILMEEGGDVEKIAEAKGMIVELDTGALEAWVDEAIANNPKAVAEYKEGKQNAIQFLMGQVMRASKGKAAAPMVIPMLKKKLS